MGHVGGDNKDGGGNTYKLPKADQGEEGSENHIRDMDNIGS